MDDAALDGGLTGPHQTLHAAHHANAHHAARAGHGGFVAKTRQGHQLQKMRAGVQQQLDALAGQQLATVEMAGDVFLAAPLAGLFKRLAQLGDELVIGLFVFGKGCGGGVEF